MTTIRRQSCWFALTLVLALAPAARAQEPAAVRKVVLPNLDSQIAARILALDRRLDPVQSPDLAASILAQANFSPFGAFAPVLADKHNRDVWDFLPDEYYRLMQESGDALVTLGGAPELGGVGWSSAQVRRLCQQRLAMLPRGSLNLYRDRVDPEARALLEQARRSRSPLPLRRVANELICSRSAEKAIDLLGELAFERGDFDQARHWWGLLAPMGPGITRRSHVPDSSLDRAGLEAKQILALMFAGRLDEARDEIERYQLRHPNGRGHLAGRVDRYADILRQVLMNLARERVSNNDEPWTTFGGDPTRNRVLSQGLHCRLWEDGPAWHVPLPALNTSDEDAKTDLADRGDWSRRLAFHPVIVNNQVLIADHRSVVSYHLTTGKELFRYDLKGAGLPDPGPGVAKTARPRYTLSADQRRAYVRLGGLTLVKRKRPLQTDASYLICLDLTEPEKDKKRELWRVESGPGEKEHTFFEGAPLAHDGSVYIAQSRLAGRRVVTAIACYDLLGRRRWSRDVCDCPPLEEGGKRQLHLLTWAGGQIAYASHSGAIVAVDAWTGQPTWGVRYPSRGALTADLTPSPRDLAPCLYADGCVFAAPLDTDRVFCIDAITGLVRWELDGVEVSYLVGAAHGRLFAATPSGLCAIRIASGQIAWMQPSEGRLPSLGRGLIAGGWLIWPTADPELPYRAVTLTDGQQQKQGAGDSVLPEPGVFYPNILRKLPVGNLAFGQGCLAIAGKDELVVYAPAHKLDVPINPRPPILLNTKYQEARRLESAGKTNEAALAYRQLLELTRSEPRSAAWRQLIESRRQRLTNVADDSNRVDLPKNVVSKLYARLKQNPDDANALAALRQRAADALKAERWSEAADAYRRICAADVTEEVHAQSLLGLIRAYEGQKDYRSAWKSWGTVDEKFRGHYDPASRKSFRALIPNDRREPYLSGLTTLRADGPALPLVQAWSQEDGRVCSIDADDCQAFVFCTREKAVSCRRPSDGRLLWTKRLDFEPAWLMRWRDLIVVSGADAAQALRVGDGESAWIFHAPSRLHRLAGVRDGVPKLISASAGFVLAKRWDDTLLLLDDYRRFLRLRLDTGEVVWQYTSPAAALRPLGAGAFGPHVVRLGSSLFVQDNAGQPCRLDAKLTPVGAKMRPWAQAPVRVGDRLVRAVENGRIIAQHRAPPHEVLWTYQAPWTTSLTGDLCRLACRDDVLLAGVARNEGTDWIRLDVARGNLLWTIPARKLPDGVSIETVCIGDTSFFYADVGKLYARSLNDGSLQWTHSLPVRGEPWQIRYTKDYLAVYPAKAGRGDAFAVHLIDPWDGSLLQRLTFVGVGPAGEVVLTPGQLLVSAGGRIFGFRTLRPE